MVATTPEDHLIAGFYPERITQLLRYDDLTLGSDLVSHTNKYNSAIT